MTAGELFHGAVNCTTRQRGNWLSLGLYVIRGRAMTRWWRKQLLVVILNAFQKVKCNWVWHELMPGSGDSRPGDAFLVSSAAVNIRCIQLKAN